MSDYNQLFQDIKTGIAQLAKEQIPEAVQEGTEMGHNFIDETKTDLIQWTDQLTKGELKEPDFKDLVLGEKDIFKEENLTAKGLLLIKIDKFKNAVIDLTLDKIFKMIK
jgi:hypothetical protein